jgi:serine/threonine-protein kinase RsbW
MQSFSETYDDLEVAIDEIRQLLDNWLEASDEAPMSTWVTGDAPSRSAPTDDRGTRSAASGEKAESSSSTPKASTSEAREEPPSYDLVRSASTPSSPDDSSQEGSPVEHGRPSVLRYVQVVLHEWIANMIQHADFGETQPRIEIIVRADQRFVSCSVIDNSRGFNLSDALTTQRNEARALPERGMGLRIISACTEQCAYRSLPDGRYRFEFSIPVDHDPWLSTLF